MGILGNPPGAGMLPNYVSRLLQDGNHQDETDEEARLRHSVWQRLASTLRERDDYSQPRPERYRRKQCVLWIPPDIADFWPEDDGDV